MLNQSRRIIPLFYMTVRAMLGWKLLMKKVKDGRGLTLRLKAIPIWIKTSKSRIYPMRAEAEKIIKKKKKKKTKKKTKIKRIQVKKRKKIKRKKRIREARKGIMASK